ncbi:RNA polymerase RpoN-/SigL-like sigma 54 subunit [Luteimonas cucumeris]|uniref:RNA polymerase sigma-54 factor n=1 Tax=Luteimonas cucumeris TaxID=985012 RepID=A0A562L5C1_9GAMM|nr:RNA polymerase factor sigma-54 [Luteimonas cucumeris]TWI02785.1 RNA polymerase RpoN-/SigL-like sigma 54 subunit [Luteimonas cucumeris]
MKMGISAQLGQQLHLTPQLLQSIRLLQLSGLQLEMEVQRALEHNPLLELEEDAPSPADGDAVPADAEVAAFDELPESSIWDVAGTSWSDRDDDRLQQLQAGESTDLHVRVLDRLALELDARQLQVAAFWLDHVDDAGYLQQDPVSLALIAAAQFDISIDTAESLRQRLLHGDPAGLAARDLRECLQAQLSALDEPAPGRTLAARILDHCIDLLAAHDLEAIAQRMKADATQVRQAVRLILSLQPRPGEAAEPAEAVHVIPDVVAWHADCAWRVALNPATTPRLRVPAMHERALEQAAQGDGAGSTGVQKMRDLLQEARWLTRGLSMRYDTLLRTTRAIVERQAGYLVHGDEAMAPLTLKEIADEIGMHESTVSRITTGKYLQTPRGTFELKHFFAVRLEGASVSGPAVRAMVRRLIEAEPAGRPLADEAIAGLLARQGVHIARRTVAKYREQLDIAPARARRTVPRPLAKAG